MKTITEPHEYPNMSPLEIIDLGYSLSGDALRKFAKSVVAESADVVVEHFEEKIQEAKDGIASNQLGLF